MTRPTVSPLAPVRDQRGVALIMAMLALLVLSLAVAGIMMTLNTDTKVAGHQLRGSQALYIAEAGIAEAEARIRFGDVPNNLNPRMVAQIFNASAGSVPELGADSVALGTQQPAGAWLDYSSATPSDRVLTISYKTDPDRTVIYRYDPSRNPAVQTESGLPIFVVRVTGRKGQDKVTIIEEVIQRPYLLNVKAALAAEVGITFSGTSNVCGWNHSVDTPAYTMGRPACVTGNWELGFGELSGAWSCGAIDTTDGNANQDGYPPISEHQTGFYAGPWEALTMSQQEFFTWVGQRSPTEVNPPRGIIYLDKDNTTQNHVGQFSYQGGNGEGFLYIDGDVRINGNFTYVGMIYIEGDLEINGTCWILGGLIVKGVSTIKLANGTCTILYSSDAIQQKIAKYGGSMMKLAWREVS